MQTRAAFLQGAPHRLGCVYSPVRASWLSQIEIQFSLRVRRLLKRGNCASINELQQSFLDFSARRGQAVQMDLRRLSADRLEPVPLLGWAVRCTSPLIFRLQSLQ